MNILHHHKSPCVLKYKICVQMKNYFQCSHFQTYKSQPNAPLPNTKLEASTRSLNFSADNELISLTASKITTY